MLRLRGASTIALPTTAVAARLRKPAARACRWLVMTSGSGRPAERTRDRRPERDGSLWHARSGPRGPGIGISDPQGHGHGSHYGSFAAIRSGWPRTDPHRTMANLLGLPSSVPTDPPLWGSASIPRIRPEPHPGSEQPVGRELAHGVVLFVCKHFFRALQRPS